MSERERVSWVGLVVTVLITAWYFGHVIWLPADADVLGPRAFRSAPWLALGAYLACGIILRIVQKRTGGGGDAAVQDERDTLINLKATRNAFYAICCLVLFTLWLVTSTDRMQRGVRDIPEADTVLELITNTGPLGGQHFGMLLLLVFSVAMITLHATRVFYYRRGF